jgi:hypothetical protein
VQALGSNGQVDLSWTASTTPGATYDVYRTQNLQFPAARVNGPPVAGTSYSDTSVTNTVTYYYYLVAVDPDGFKSRRSHFNTDCGGSETDCLSATPLNPNPPGIPSNVAVEDPGIGDTLFVEWDAPSENDVAYHTVFWGTASGEYGSSAVVSSGSAYQLSGLAEGQPYFFAVSATNTSGLTSDLSDEASDFPVLGPGLRPPRFVSDLQVNVSGDDLELLWGEVLLDVYGKPVQVERYEIFRGVSPGFDNASFGPPVGECFAPCTSWVDVGAMLAPDAYHYRVRAVDPAGNAGGLGADPPRFTELSIGRSTTTMGALVLEWNAVSVRTSGGPTQISHYEIYAADVPFTPAQVRDGLVPLLDTTGEISMEVVPPAPDRYYSVIAVDSLGNRSPF